MFLVCIFFIPCLIWPVKITITYKFSLPWIQSLPPCHEKVSPRPIQIARVSIQRQPWLKLCVLPEIFHAVYIVILQNTYFPLTKGRRQTPVGDRHQSARSPACVIHYLASIDHCASFFLCRLHCPKEHAHCLLGVQWPIQNISWREKGMFLILPYVASF